jgi:hypothetical protein
MSLLARCLVSSIRKFGRKNPSLFQNLEVQSCKPIFSPSSHLLIKDGNQVIKLGFITITIVATT